MAEGCRQPVMDKTLELEAEAAIKDVSFAVNEVQISRILPVTEERVYLNMTTQEKDKFCVELSSSGFLIVGKDYDQCEENVRCMSRHFETVYSLLDSTSRMYRQSFGNSLMEKLQNLQQENDFVLKDT